jgi:hypothetical protein
MNYLRLVDKYLLEFSRISGAPFVGLDTQGATQLKRGSATVVINVLVDHGVLLLLSPIMPVPERHQLSLYRRLLELNFLGTADAGFAIDSESEMVYLRAMRQLQGLDFDEFAQLVDAVAKVADEWDDPLRAEFGH